MKHLLLLLLFASVPFAAVPQQRKKASQPVRSHLHIDAVEPSEECASRKEQAKGNCPVIQIVPERLPDLTLPRSGHTIFYVNGELTVAGGHTTHFVPTPSAEYYDGGEWHQVPMAYNHDNGFAAILPSGEVIVGGGHNEPLGIGQTYMLERYSPATHTFEGFGCLDRRRTLANANLLADGRVIISGNHYTDDAIACYDGSSQVQHVKNVVQGRSNPYILPIADNDAIIISGCDTRQNTPDTIWADRVKGDAFRVPLLEQWRLVYTDQPFNSDACAIDEPHHPLRSSKVVSTPLSKMAPKGGYLLTATDPNGQLAIIQMHDTCFSLLTTVCPIPMKGPFGPVFYKGPIVTDKKRRRGYVIGVDSLYNRQYVLCVDYGQKPAQLSLYYTDTIGHATITIPVVTPSGDLVLAGGIPNDNYKPLATVWLYRFGSDATPAVASLSTYLWWSLPLAALLALACAIFYYRKKAQANSETPPRPQKSSKILSNPLSPACSSPQGATGGEPLLERICQLMDEQQLFRNSELKASDVAEALGTNSRYVTESIKECCNKTFNQFVNDYRIRYVQQLLLQTPDRKILEFYTEAGFASERSFFRIFKETTGMTTTEWIHQNIG